LAGGVAARQEQEGALMSATAAHQSPRADLFDLQSCFSHAKHAPATFLPHAPLVLPAAAKHGADVMHTSKLGRKLAADIQAAGGLVTAEDLARAQPQIKPAMRAHVYGVEVRLGSFRALPAISAERASTAT